MNVCVTREKCSKLVAIDASVKYGEETKTRATGLRDGATPEQPLARKTVRDKKQHAIVRERQEIIA